LAVTDKPLPWLDPVWFTEARAWIEARLDGVGDLDQFHVRWWSTVIRVPTDEGDLYFKAVGRGFEFEPPLTAKLAQLMPDRVTELVDVDAEHGWMLMRDGGDRLREVVRVPADLHHWERALPRYAELQIAAAPAVDELLALGVPDERLAVLPNHLRAILAEPLPRLSPGQHERMLAALPNVEAMCRELATYGIPETIQHDDLHDGQVFVRDGDYRFFDWGDSCVSHPLLSLTVALRSIAWRLDLEPGGPELRRLRDLYLEPFGRGPEIADAAYRVGTIARGIAWDRMVSAREPEFVDEDDLSGPAYGIRLFLEGGPIGSWQYPGP
jgi:Phosphotransferase enzyme family